MQRVAESFINSLFSNIFCALEECKEIITEAVFISRWALVEGYWNLGKRIKEDKNMQKYAKGNWSSLQRVAKNIGIDDRTIYYALQAHKKYPDIQLILEGKNISCKNMLFLIPFPAFPSELELE